jgi:hypothetical protein
MSRLLTATTEMVPLLVSALILFVVPLASCANGGDEGNRDSSDEGVTSYSANADPRDGAPVEEVASPAGVSDDTGGQGELSERADQNSVGTLPSGESGPPEENSGGEAGSSEYSGANPVAELPERVYAAPVSCGDCPYYFDADGDGIGAGDSAGYELGKEPPGWVPSYPDNCPDVYNSAVDQYGTGQPDSDGDGVGDACDPDTPGQYGDGTGPATPTAGGP